MASDILAIDLLFLAREIKTSLYQEYISHTRVVPKMHTTTIIDEDQRLTFEEITQEEDLSKRSVQCIMQMMTQKRKICAGRVPLCLNRSIREFGI